MAKDKSRYPLILPNSDPDREGGCMEMDLEMIALMDKLLTPEEIKAAVAEGNKKLQEMRSKKAEDSKKP